MLGALLCASKEVHGGGGTLAGAEIELWNRSVKYGYIILSEGNH